jgi:prepilin-type N-terminal cleavage/methylation domain-containing protein
MMIRRDDDSQPSRLRIGGFTLIELLVVIGIIAILVSILLPTLSVARRNSQRVACREKLHDIGNVVQAYLNDSKDVIWIVNPVPWIQTPYPLNGFPSVPEVFTRYTGGQLVSYPNNSCNATGWMQMTAGRKGWLCPSDYLAKTTSLSLYSASSGTFNTGTYGGIGASIAGATRYYDIGGSSYRVNTFLNDYATLVATPGIISPAPKLRQVLDAFSIMRGRFMNNGPPPGATPDYLAAQMFLFTDWDVFHTAFVNNPQAAANDVNAQNYLFADFHVGPMQ